MLQCADIDSEVGDLFAGLRPASLTPIKRATALVQVRCKVSKKNKGYTKSKNVGNISNVGAG